MRNKVKNKNYSCILGTQCGFCWTGRTNTDGIDLSEYNVLSILVVNNKTVAKARLHIDLLRECNVTLK